MIREINRNNEKCKYKYEKKRRDMKRDEKNRRANESSRGEE